MTVQLIAACGPNCERAECVGCLQPLCIDHSPDFYGCDATGDCHDGCHDVGCGPCQDEAARPRVLRRGGPAASPTCYPVP